MESICKDEREFFRTVLESLRGTDSEYCEEHGIFDEIPRTEWESVLDDYVSDVLYENIQEKNVMVDFENVGEGGEFTNGGLKGLKRLATGEYFYCFDCGGDWEVPVNAIIYVEDGEVKFHVPERGNDFDSENMVAYDNNGRNAGKIDKNEELKEIEEFLHRRARDGRCATEEGADKLMKELNGVKNQLEGILGARKGVFASNDVNCCYCVTMSVWCVRKGRNGKPNTMCANSSNSYPNAFKTYDEAVDYVHAMMMANHNDKLHNWNAFKERISIVDEKDDVPPVHGIGYVHYPMMDGVERFEGFDVGGAYPCLVDDFIIARRSVKTLENDCSDGFVAQSSMKVEPVQVDHCIKSEKISEFTPREQEEHQKDMDWIVDEMSGIESMFAGDGNGEFDKMKDILGWDEDGGGK